MRIIHIADLHLGQVIYQHYDRVDEHLHFFSQLEGWLAEYRPDALVISGDIFDIQQPSASVWKTFTDTFVKLRKKFSDIHFVIVAGNHDSPSRLQSHSEVWGLAGVSLIGTPPPTVIEPDTCWEDRFVVRLQSGYIIALPFMTGERTDVILHLQEYVERENAERLPVVMTGHMAVTGSDTEGHDLDIGTLRTVDLSRFGEGYDYLALGHIHKPQTLSHPTDWAKESVSYPAPLARYSGSVLHVSGDEAYPHSASLVDIDTHGGEVRIHQLRIEQFRHFHTLPAETEEAFQNEKEAIKGIKKFIEKNDRVYLRMKFSATADLPPDFNSKVYSLIEESGKDIRYNPKPYRVAPAEEETDGVNESLNEIEVSELQQMVSPLDFIRKTIDRYPELSLEELEEAFKEIEEELRKMNE